MKTIAIISVMTCLSMTSVPQRSFGFPNSPNVAATADQERQPERVKIGKLDLPAEAKRALEGTDFRGWTLVAAYRTKDGEYEVELKRGETVQVIKFDKEGRLK